MHDWIIEALVVQALGYADQGYYRRRALHLLRQLQQERPELKTVDELAAAVRVRMNAGDS
jgi:hypothetical protein